MIQLSYYRSLLAQANAPKPAPLPEMGSRAAEAMAAQHDIRVEREWRTRVNTATDELLEALPILLTNFEALTAGMDCSPWEPIETYPKNKEEFVLLACADWIGDIPVKVGEWRDGEWKIFGGSWEPTHWCRLPDAPARIPPRPYVEPWVDGGDVCHVLMSHECESGVNSGFTEVYEGLRNARISIQKSGQPFDENSPIKMCKACRPLFLERWETT